MNKIHIRSLLLLSALLVCVIGFGQTNDKTKLEEDKKKLEEEIRLTNTLLEETRKDKKNSLNELVLINRKIEQREKLIKTLDAQLYNLNFAIDYNNKEITGLEKRLKQQKAEYAQLLFSVYKNRNSYSRMMYIFSSDNFKQAYQRLKYLQQYNRHRESQYDLIISLQDSLMSANKELKKQKLKKSKLKKTKIKENSELKEAKANKNNMIAVLSGKERELKANIDKKKKAARNMKKTLQKVIRKDMAKNNSKNTKKYNLSPDQKVMANNFAKNKGKLPWPTKTGIISSTFGEHKHAVLKYVKTKNDGIDIQTAKGAKVYAVFDGVVTFAGSIPAYNNAVFIRHGEYVTAYSKLEKVFVKVGDKVSMKQEIGTIFKDPVENKTELHFEIWKNFKPQNPIKWITK